MEETFESFRATLLEFKESYSTSSFVQYLAEEQRQGDASRSDNISYQRQNYFVSPWDEEIHRILRRLEYFVCDISWESEILIFFYPCIDKWSHALIDLLILKPLVIKMETSLKRISTKLDKYKRHVQTCAREMMTIETRERSLNNWIPEIFDDFYNDILSLKSEIRQALDSFPKQSFFPSLSLLSDFHGWQHFVESTKLKLESLVSNPKHIGLYPNKRHRLLPDLANQISCFSQMIYGFSIFGHLPRIFSRNSDLVGLMGHLGTVIICAALMYCECWSMGMDPDLIKMKDMANTFLDLRMKINSITPAFVDLVLKRYILYGGHASDESVDLIVKCLLGSTNPKFLCVELMALIKHYIILSQPRGNPDYLQRFIVNVKQVIMRARSRQIILQNTYETSSDLADILTMIRLVKVEIFLRYQLNAPGSLSVNDQDRFQILKELATASWTIHFYPVDNAEKVHQILTILEEVATVLASIRGSFLAEVAPTKMLRSILFKLLISIMLFKAKSSLANLLSDNDIR